MKTNNPTHAPRKLSDGSEVCVVDDCECQGKGKPSHTPGPRVRNVDFYAVDFKEVIAVYWSLPNGERPRIHAKIEYPSSLIAAAPELLADAKEKERMAVESLGEIDAAYPGHLWEDSPGGIKTVRDNLVTMRDDARAAIAKAEAR